jgi:hypothetical protein
MELMSFGSSIIATDVYGGCEVENKKMTFCLRKAYA